MKNLKILAIAGVIATTAGISNANAETKGNYVGLDLIRSRANFNTNNYGGNNRYGIEKDNKVSLGINYKYAFNFNKFFVAPGAFYDYTNLTMKEDESWGGKWNLDNRFGLGVDLGYDITDKFAVFGNVSGVRNMYEVDWTNTNEGTKSDHDDTMSYGIGAKYSVMDNLDIKTSYEISSVTMKQPSVYGRSVEFNVEAIRLGVAYKF